MNQPRMLRRWLAAPMLAVLMGGGQSASAAETIDLTAIDGYPTKALWVREFVDFFIPAIDAKLAKTGDYQINWNQAWGGQIVKPKHVLEGLQRGLGDIGVVTTVFHPDKVPLQMVAYATPFVTVDPDLVARTIDDLADRFPEVKQAWAKYNQVYLTNLVVLDTYQMFSNKPVARLDDLAGMKIAGAGMNLRYLQGLKVAGVGGSLVGYYNKLKTGVVDGAMVWPEAAMSFKLYEVAPHMLDARIGTVNSKAITVNKRTWDRLPEPVRKAIAEAAIEYRDHVSKVVMERATKSYEAYQANGGSIVVLSDAERDRWAATMPNVAGDWAASLEKKGLPGRAYLSAYMDALRAAGQTPAREWDQE